jgi:hypothetical protein
MGNRLRILHLVSAGVYQRGEHPHRHVAAGASGVGGGEHLDREVGVLEVVEQSLDHPLSHGAQAIGPVLLAVVGLQQPAHAGLVDLLPGREEAVVLTAKVTVEGRSVETGTLDDRAIVVSA